MTQALCCSCAEDSYLSEIIESEGSLMQCSMCGSEDANAFTVAELAEMMEPIMREHFSLGQQIKKFGADDAEWWEQEGDPMSWVIQEVLGQYLDFEDKLIDAIIEAEDVWPQDGDEPFWDTASSYVESRVLLGQYFADWRHTVDELKYGRRFFSSSAQALFAKLFSAVDQLVVKRGKTALPVVRQLPIGAPLFRARVCNARSMLKDVYKDPLVHVGPPPKDRARVGRMNAEGVVVLYCARERDTCLAEMRPAIGNELAVITVKTTKTLRVLDFSRLDQARSRKGLSYFQPDFSDQVEVHAFLRRLHHQLISQPVIPGREADYLITQTMAEYLAHVHQPPFDGILFSSAQRPKGINVVLFPEPDVITDSCEERFRIAYVEDSIQLFSTSSIRYQHHQLVASVTDDGDVWIGDGMSGDAEDFG